MRMMHLLAVCLLSLAVSSTGQTLSSQATTLADRSASLAFSFYHTVAKEEGLDNILISPLVVASAMGIVALGGKHSTASQVKSVLSVDALSDEHLHAGLSELLVEVRDAKARNTTWKMASRLYVPSLVTFTDGFVKSSKKHYDYDHSKVNLKDKRSMLNSINEWAADSTDGKLSQITKDMQNADGATIVNAMFIKPHWEEKFHESMVDSRGFQVTRSFTVAVQMMHRTGLYDFHEDTENKLYVLCMPLGKKQSSLVLIMPYFLEPLERLEKLLTRSQLDAWLGKVEQKAIAISMPKVSMEVSHNLQKHLGELGLTDVVDKAKADLSKISGKKDLYLSNVFHASALELDTEGNPFDTSIFSTDKLKNPKLFYADHPFIFLVKDNKTNSILFIGRMVRPKGDKMRDEL